MEAKEGDHKGSRRKSKAEHVKKAPKKQEIKQII
jgi:hypothetical protein